MYRSDYSRQDGWGDNTGTLCHGLGTDDDGKEVQRCSLSMDSAYSGMSLSTNSNLSLSSLLSYQNISSRSIAIDGNGQTRNSRWNRMIYNRWPRSREKPLFPPSQNLFQAQLRLLCILTGGSIVLFLFAFLNIYAFSALAFTGLSSSMLLYTIHSHILHLLNSDTLTIYDHLPLSLQKLLTTTTIHEYMAGDCKDDGDSFFEANRFLLLYFLPGITAEQKLRMAQNLPQRHRDTIFTPGGMARFFLPEGVYRRLVPRRTDPSRNASLVTDGSSYQLIPAAMDSLHDYKSGSVSSRQKSESPSSLAVSVGHDNVDGRRDSPTNTAVDDHSAVITPPSLGEGDTDHDNQNERSLVTVRDKFAGLVYTVENWVLGEATPTSTLVTTSKPPSSEEEEKETFSIVPLTDLLKDLSYDDDSNINDQLVTSSSGHGNSNKPDVDDSALAIGSTNPLEESPMTLPQIIPTSMNSPTARLSPQLLPPSVASPQSQQQPEDPIELAHERRVESEILSTAINTMIKTYSNTASGLFTNTAETIVEKSAPTVIRAGATLSSLSGVSLLGYFSSVMGGGGSGGVSMQRRQTQSNGGDGGRYRLDTAPGCLIVIGLSTMLFTGIFSAGSTLLIRSYVRNMVVARRKEVLNGSDNSKMSESTIGNDDRSPVRTSKCDRNKEL